MSIHPSAIIDPSAELADGVKIGPWTIIGPNVKIGSGTVIASHVVIAKDTEIGEDNRIFQFSSIGEDCQDKKYAGEKTRLVIGDRNVIRESCTVHRGTVQDRSTTEMGSDNLLMAYVHVAHDCVIGDHTILANNVTLAGHVKLGNNAILGGGSMVHQFCQIGPHSMCAGGSIVLKDVPAYVMAGGQSAAAHGMNTEGLKRRGFSKEAMLELRRAYKVIYRQGNTLKQAIDALEEVASAYPEVAVLRESLISSTRGIVR